MDAKLVGIHSVKTKSKDGTPKTYYYAWRGGPRMKSKPGTKAFLQEFVRLTKDRETNAKHETLSWLVDQYRASADFQKLKPATRKDYERMMGAIKVKFGDMPLQFLDAKGPRSQFLAWRDSMGASPRSADLHIAILARVLSWGKDREIITRNPLERASKLHDGGNRKDRVWMPNQIETFLTKAAPHLAAVVKVALWTMQRQSDVLSMKVVAYQDDRLWIKQGKTGARVRIAPAEEIVALLEAARTAKRHNVLVNSFGDNWTPSGFRASFRKEMAKLEIKGVTFHDLRGTGISYAYANGAAIEQIAEVSGHSKTECEAIIRRHYLAGGDVIEAIRAGTKRV